jgi:glycosyltransferase involved in cell wall biosynthesis
MKISYAVTVCDEFIEIQRLLTFLLEHKRPQDEIVIQMDLSVADLNSMLEAKKLVWQYIMKHNEQGHCRVIFNPLRNDFAAFKNHLKDQCTGDYIFQIDADEVPNELLMQHLPELLEMNPDNEVYLVPRINTVEGLTEEHVEKWGWNVNAMKWVNWPDYQWRIWKNTADIIWINKVHEQLTGFKTYSMLPADTDALSLYHPKTIDKQEKQNNYYDTLG